MRRLPWAKLAAATGIGFVVTIGAAAVVMELKDIAHTGDVVVASNEVFGTVALLTGFAATLLFWFASTTAARARLLEGGSGRIAAVINTSGAFIAGGLALTVGCLFGARNYGVPELAALATAIADGPTLLFPAIAFVGGVGIVGVRAEGLPQGIAVFVRLSVLLAAAYAGGAGLHLFKNYAWINDTAYIVFLVWVLLLSIIGIARWGDMDVGADVAAPVGYVPRPTLARTERDVVPPPPPPPPSEFEGPATVEMPTVEAPAERTSARKPKPAGRKSTVRKPRARKPGVRKPTPRKGRTEER